MYDVILWEAGPRAPPPPRTSSVGPYRGAAGPGRRIKPCGGAIPPRLIADFHIPRQPDRGKDHHRADDLPHRAQGGHPIENGFVGMVDREHFDEFLRVRATEAGPNG